MFKYLVLAGLVFPVSAFAQCPVKIGDIAVMESAKEAFSNFKSAPVKNEFEKSDDFQKRLDAFEASNREPRLVENTASRRIIEYNADEERFEIRASAFGDEPLLLWGTTKDFPSSLKPKRKNFTIEISEEVAEAGTYEASNAYGATVNVKDKNSEVYNVYDSPGGKIGRSHWEPDARVKSDSSKYKWDTMYLDMPPEKAKELKDSIQFGLAFSPKPPFYFETSRISTPTIRNPNRRYTKYHNIAADISCAFMTDGNGRVLKIAMPK